MKLVKLFFDVPLPEAGANTPGRLIRMSEASKESLSVVFEWPATSREVAFVTRKILPEGQIYWDMGLWLITDEAMAQIDQGQFLAVNSKPAKALQMLVRFAQREWSPVAKVFSSQGASTQNLIEVWFKYPDVFYGAIVKHRPRSLLTRQNFYVILRWGEWKRTRRTMQECVEEMEFQNLGGGNLNAKNLSKRAERLDLY